MGFYDTYILPQVINKACSVGQVMKLRQRVVPRATGVVLEVGMGSGINLPLYDSNAVTKVYGLEPSEGMRLKAQSNLRNSLVEVEWLDLPGEAIPLPDHSIDTIVLTFTLCTIPDWEKALTQMFRVLRPDGRLLFCEHGQSPEPGVAKWQNRVTPGWKKIAGGCHLNRPIADYLQHAGFTIKELENLYMPKAPRIAAYIYIGLAEKPA